MLQKRKNKIVKTSRNGNGALSLDGQRFGSIVVLNRAGSELLGFSAKKNKTIYKSVFSYKCDCGNIKTARGSDIKSGKIVSCGCSKSTFFKKINDKKRKHVHSGFSFLWQSYKTGAKKRGLDFLLSKEKFVELTSSNCFYCEEAPSRIRKTRYKHATYGYKFNGIDRVVNSIGYVDSNCVPCCYDCNIMKMDSSPDDFINKCKKIAILSSKKKQIGAAVV